MEEDAGKAPPTAGDAVADRVAVGVVGLGTAGRTAAAALRTSDHCTLVAVCDSNVAVAEELGAVHRVPSYANLRQMCASGEVEAVYVATPTYMHLPNAMDVALAGKHILMEKPVAVTSAQAQALADIARAHAVQVMSVNTRGRDAPIQALSQLVERGTIGDVVSLTNVCYTNWTLRPRFAYEYVEALGGGVVLRQAPHQVEIARTVVGREVVAVTAVVGLAAPPTDEVGSYSALLEFEGGASASLLYNGHGYFSSAELTFGLGSSGAPASRDASRELRRTQAWTRDKYSEEGLKARRRSPEKRPAEHGASPHQRWGFFGLTLVSGTHGDMRQSSEGITVYDNDGVHEHGRPDAVGGLGTDFEEFHAAVRGIRQLRYDAGWGRDTVRICEALHESSGRKTRIELRS